MKRDTKRIEQLLANARASRKLVREEIAAGSSLQHVYDDLGNHEQIFGTRLKDLRSYNAYWDTQRGKAELEQRDKEKADREGKAKEEADKKAEVDKLDFIRKGYANYDRQMLLDTKAQAEKFIANPTNPSGEIENAKDCLVVINELLAALPEETPASKAQSNGEQSQAGAGQPANPKNPKNKK
jgi:hypothetical protein